MSPVEHQKFTRFAPFVVMGMVALVGGVFFTVLNVQQNQDNRSRASITSGTYNGTLTGDNKIIGGSVTGDIIGNRNTVGGNVAGCVQGNGNIIGGKVTGKVTGSNNAVIGGSGSGACLSQSQPTSTNLLSNPGCESGTSQYKGYNATLSTTTTRPHSGSAACKITSTGGTFYDMETFQASPNPAVGETFTGSAWVRSDANNGRKAYLALREAGGSSSNRSTYGAAVTLTTEWQQVSNSLTVQKSGRTSVDYYVVQDPGSAAHIFYADDLIFMKGSTTQPTPTNTPIPPTSTPVPATPTPTPSNANAKVSVSPTSVQANETITITWSGVSSPTVKDWIGVMSSTASIDTNPWVYTSSCSKTAEATAKSSGSCTLAAPATQGVYTVKLLEDDSFVLLASGNNVTVTSAAVTVAPTAVPTITPTPSVGPATLTPTPTLTVTPTTGQPTSTPMPTVPVEQGGTALNFTLAMHGLGKGGDSANPNGTGNTSPLHPQRSVLVDVYDANNALVKSVQGTVTYDSGSGYFKGLISLGTDVTNGAYTVRVKTNQFLRALVPGIQNLITGNTFDVPLTALISGDMNNDNTINILDYNMLMGCYSDLVPATDCPAGNELKADITDDGAVNQFDYNLFLRELINRGGQ